MSALKAYQVEDFVQNKPIKSGVYLLYGSDSGLIYEHAISLSNPAGSGTDQNNDKDKERISISSEQRIILDMAEIEADPSRLAMHALTPSLFGDEPIIRIRSGNKNLVPILQDLLASKLAATIIIQASNLTKKDKLRILIEESAQGWALPCFLDDQKSLRQLVTKTFNQQSVAISDEAISYLVSILGNDRDITRRELEKLLLFADQSKIINIKNVQDLCGDNSMIAIDKIQDATAMGNSQSLEAALTTAFAANLDAQLILAASSRHFLFLRVLRSKVDSGSSAGGAIANTYPKPHFSRHRNIEVQLRLWNDRSLSRASSRLLDATLQSRRQNSIGATIARRALLGICLSAARR